MNSFAMVCEKLSLMAKNIQKQMEDDSDFPIEIIKQPELQDFKMLNYDQVPGYDPSEGINLTIKYIHPRDHPSYPHYCYPVYKVEYAKWLRETSVFAVEESFEIPISNDIKPEICACHNCPFWRDCKFSEDNPVCPGHPRCNGCNCMFYYNSIEKHLKESPTCYEIYSLQALNELLDRVKKFGAEVDKVHKEKHTAFIKKEWDEYKEHFKRHPDTTWKDFNEPTQRHYLWIKKEWKKIQNETLNSDENENSDEGEDWDAYVMNAM